MHNFRIECIKLAVYTGYVRKGDQHIITAAPTNTNTIDPPTHTLHSQPPIYALKEN